MEISKIIWIECLLFTASSIAEFQFTAPKDNCVYGGKCNLICGKIDTSQNVQLLRGGQLLLTCLASNSYESPCLVKPDSPDPGYSTYFDTRKSEILITIIIKETDDTSNWTCKNGNQEATINVYAGYQALVATFSSPTYLGNVGQEVNFVCQVLVYGSTTYDPSLVSTSITRNSDASNLTTTFSKGKYLNYRATTKLKCTDHYFSCFTTTGFGYRSNKYVSINVECPTQILYDMITTNVTIELGKSRDLELYYSGYPVSTSWYKNFPEGDMRLNRVNGIIDLPIGSRKEIMFITSAKFDDAGQYTVHLQQNDTVIKVVYRVTIVDPNGNFPQSLPITGKPKPKPTPTSTAPKSTEFQFTAPKDNCVYGGKCNLICGKIDTSQNVQLLRGGKLLLTCLASNSYESPCLVKPDSPDPGYSTYFDTRKSEIVIKIIIQENDDTSNWTCKNGNQEATINVYAGYQALVATFSSPTYLGNVGQEVNFVCQVLVYGSTTYDPSLVSTSITRNSDASNLTTTFSKGNYLNYRATTKLKCTDHYFSCFTTTGFGYRSNKYVSINVECPIQILYDMITTNVTIELGKSRDLELYYSGYPVTTSWYKNFPEGDMRLNRVNHIIDLPIGSRKEIMFITNANFGDAGQYTVHLKKNDIVIKVVYHVTIVMPTTTTHKTSTISPTTKTKTTTTTEQSEPKSITTEKRYITKAPYSTSTQINKSTVKDVVGMEPIFTTDNNRSCRQFSSVVTSVVLAFLSYNFV